MPEPKNTDLEQSPLPDTPLKKWLVNYVGDKHTPEDDRVTVQMIVDTVANEFPEFLLVVAEENWIRGYKQAMLDIEDGTRALRDRGKERLQQKNIEKSVADAVNVETKEPIQNDKE
jgi:hypothetical protein